MIFFNPKMNLRTAKVALRRGTYAGREYLSGEVNEIKLGSSSGPSILSPPQLKYQLGVS